MIRTNILALLLAAGLASVAHPAISAGRAAANSSPAAAAAAQTTAVSTLPASAKTVRMRCEVVVQTSTFITVRNPNPDQQNSIYTFTFSPQLQPKMEAILNAGGYQNGDKIVITAVAGSTVALKISGKPSKPS